MALPNLVPVKLTVQLAVVLLTVASVQLEVLKLPAPPVAVNETDPAGVVAPAPLVSPTVAVHCEGVPIGTLDGLQTIVVDVVRSVAVTVPLLAPLLELPA